MQLTALATGMLCAALVAAPAKAACALIVLTGGILALSADGTQLATDGGGLAAPATMTVANTGLTAVTVTIGAPQWTSYPAGFDSAEAELEISYFGAGLLGSVSQPYGSGQSSFEAPALLSLATLVTLNNRITSPGGFNAGTYTDRTVVTCS